MIPSILVVLSSRRLLQVWLTLTLTSQSWSLPFQGQPYSWYSQMTSNARMTFLTARSGNTLTIDIVIHYFIHENIHRYSKGGWRYYIDKLFGCGQVTHIHDLCTYLPVFPDWQLFHSCCKYECPSCSDIFNSSHTIPRPVRGQVCIVGSILAWLIIYAYICKKLKLAM